MDKNNVITGILCLYSKYKFPANKRNIPRYRFNPLSKKYPIFLVASKLKNKYKTNILVTIKFLSQEIKIPYGEIVNVIGSIDDINNLYDGILYNNNLIQKKLNINKKQISLKKDLLTIPNYKNYTEIHTISIDPSSTLDIDDALSYIEINKNNYKLGIHISDVIGTLNLYDMNKLLNNLTTSIYAPHKTINMFPKILSENILSLLPNKKRLAITLWLNIDNNIITKINFEKTVILNNIKYSYNDFEKTTISKKIIEKIKKINYNYKFIGKFDSHKMIEKLMIIYNSEVGKFILNSNKKPIFRAHTKKDNIQTIQMNEELYNFINIIKNKSAVYSFEQNYHETLDIYNYIHFTSPIRRYVDCYNHCLLHNILNNNNNQLININLDYINIFSKNIKKADRQFSKLKIEKHIINTKNHDFKGYIYDILENDKICIYIPKHKVTINTKTLKKIPLYKYIKFKIYLEFNKNKPYSKLKIEL